MPTRFTVGLLIVSVALAAPEAGALESFVEESVPSPPDESQLSDVAIDAVGRMVAVGETRTYQSGGSPFLPFLLYRESPEAPWAELDPPDLGFTYHDLRTVHFVPDGDGDFVAIGEYLPDPLLGHPDGFVLRYRRASGAWELHTFRAPGFQFHFIADSVFDPSDDDRIWIVGTKGRSDPGGGCFHFETLVVDYRLATHNYTIHPTTTLGGLSGIAPLGNGRFLAVGIRAIECDYDNVPIVLEIGDGGFSAVRPNPPPDTPGVPFYRLTGATHLADGRALAAGMEALTGGSHFRTLSYVYDPETLGWTPYKPLDPDSTTHAAGFTNQIFRVETRADGRIFGTGRYHYIRNSRHYYGPLIESFDGGAWSLHSVPDSLEEGAWNAQLGGVAFAANGVVYTVGEKNPPGVYDDACFLLRGDSSSPAQVDPTPTTTGERTRPELRVLRNPALDTVDLEARTYEPGRLRLEIVDVTGRTVRTIFDRHANAGAHRVHWDGRDEEGAATPPGVYFARLTSPQGAQMVKVTRLVHAR